MTMQSRTAQSPAMRAMARIDVLDMLAFVILVLAAGVIWTKATPFANMQDYALLDDPTRSNGARKVIMLALALATGGLVLLRGQLGTLIRFVSVPLVLMFGWFGLTCLLSPAAKLGIDRLALAAIVIFIAACLPLMFVRVETFVVALATAVTLMIVLSFLGAIFIPDLAIHTAKDVNEQRLAGDWRGIFSHKNDLAAMTAHFGLAGILLMRTRRRVWGGLILVSSFVLMVLSGGKSAGLLIGPALLFGAILVRVPSRALSGALVVAVVGGLALVTVGSVAFTWMHDLLAALMPDPTFTGRTDLWSLALEAIKHKPLVGYGYNTFWDTGQAFAIAGKSDAAIYADHAHNGFLSVTLSAGVPGLLLVLFWVGVIPWRNIEAVKRHAPTGIDAAFLDFLVQSWLLTLLVSNLEAILFNRGDPIWFSGLLAVACLHYWAPPGGQLKSVAAGD